VAVGTIADVMPLLDENRLLVRMGLKELEKGETFTSRALLHLLKVTGKGKTGKIDSSTIGFTVAPRINAAGRMENAQTALKLFLSDSEKEVAENAATLCRLNQTRQEEEARILREAVEQAEERSKSDKILVLASDNWHCGVIGIVASRITEKYGKPSILISFQESGEGKGSGRSVKGFHLAAALQDCQELLIKYGGHEMAAGLSIRKEKVDAFRQKINQIAKELPNAFSVPTLDVECAVGAEDLTLDQVDQLQLLEPYGTANPSPLFLLSSAILTDVQCLGEKHTKLVIQSGNSRFAALLFGHSRKSLDLVVGDQVDLVFSLNRNEYRSTVSLQLLVRDIRLSQQTIRPSERSDLARILSGEVSHQKDWMPVREDFAAVYRWLKYHTSLGDGYCSVRQLLSAFPTLGYVKIQLALQILVQAGLVVLESGDFSVDLFRFSLPATDRKVSLESTPLYCFLTDSSHESVGF
jgi:single-stranded-DNA-specific exonuclease